MILPAQNITHYPAVIMSPTVFTPHTPEPKTELYACSRCGKYTDWNFNLGPKPLCTDCWDREIDRQYREKYSLKLRERKRRWRIKNMEHVREYERKRVAAKKHVNVDK